MNKFDIEIQKFVVSLKKPYNKVFNKYFIYITPKDIFEIDKVSSYTFILKYHPQSLAVRCPTTTTLFYAYQKLRWSR